MASDAQPNMQHNEPPPPPQQQQQDASGQYLELQRVLLSYHLERMRAGDGRLLPLVQGMRRMVMSALPAPAGQQQQQQEVQQRYLDAYTEVSKLCAGSGVALDSLDAMCSIALGPLALGKAAGGAQS
jgi:hypothetical protein